jgi:RNA polymerase sigma-70 factor (ECF subfamily)
VTPPTEREAARALAHNVSMSQGFDEAGLIRAAQQGKLTAFNRLVVEYQSLGYNVAYRILGDGEAAADATQDAFLKAYKAISQYRGGSFKAWLLRIVTNVCYDLLRSRQRRPADSLDELLSHPEYAPALINGREGPEAHALREELNRTLQAAIMTLPDDQRTVLVLADVQGMSYQEVAQITRTSLGTVKSRLSRARAKLRDALLQHPELLPRAYRLQNE